MTTPPPTDPAPAPPPAPDGGLEPRVKSLEDGQQGILSKLDQLLHRTAPAAPAAPRPEDSVGEEIRRQLAAAGVPAAPPAPSGPNPPPEVPPKPPVRKITKALWGDDD